MIQVEHMVFDYVQAFVQSVFGNGVTCSTVPVPKSATLPYVYVQEAMNSVYTPTKTFEETEFMASLTYEISVYYAEGGKLQADNIVQVVDQAMNKLGFQRSSSVSPFPDGRTWRKVLRYSGVAQRPIDGKVKIFTA